MKRIRIRRVVLIVSVIISLCVLGLLLLNNYVLNNLETCTNNTKDDNIISFSIKPGIYDHSISIELNNKISFTGDYKILYTIDGNDPYYDNSYIKNKEQEVVTFEPSVYNGAINIDPIDNNIIVVPIKAVIYFRGHYSKVVEKTYIVSDGDINQYTDLPIISVTANHRDLYDYYDGILVEGYLGDLYSNGDKNGVEFGNLNVERKIKSNVSFIHTTDYSYYGNTDLSLGGLSSKFYLKEKSFKIQNDNRFHVDFDDSQMKDYYSLKMRSGSQDYYYSNIRSSIVSKIGHELDFDGTPNSKRMILYLNGEFYSIIDLMDNNSKENIRDKYNLPDKSIEEKESGYFCSLANNVDDSEFDKYIDEVVDIDDLLLYTAIEIFVNNTDWPNNNVKMWRYTGKANDNKYTDGKWRFILNDFDISWWTGGEFFEGINNDNLDSLIKGKYRSNCDLYKKLFKSDLYRNRLSELISNISNNLYKDDKIYNIIDYEYSIIYKSQKFYLDNNEALEINVNNIKTFVKEREDRLKNNNNYYFSNILYKYYLESNL